jgi:hypothetical protein
MMAGGLIFFKAPSLELRQRLKPAEPLGDLSFALSRPFGRLHGFVEFTQFASFPDQVEPVKQPA